MKFGNWRRWIAFVLTFDLALAPLVATAHEDKADGRPVFGPFRPLVDNAPPQDPSFTSAEAEKYFGPILKAAERLEAGERAELKAEDLDIWALGKQYVELFDGTKEPHEAQTPTSTYPLDQAALQRLRPAFTKLKAKFDENTGKLYFEATRGENEKGEHGTLVARMHVPRVKNIAALAQDEEILTIVDRRGRVSIIDWGWVAATAFLAPVQVQKSVWLPNLPQDFPEKSVQATYITRGMRTLDATNLYSPDVTFPADADGKPIHRAGDLVIRVNQQLFAILSRENFHKTIQLNQAILYSFREWLEDNPQGMERLGDFLAEADRDIEGFVEGLKDVEKRAMDPLFAKALQAFPRDVLKSMHDRIKANAAALKRPGDAMSAAEHDDYFTEIEREATLANQADDEYMLRNWKKLVPRRNQTRAQQDAVVNESPAKQRVRNVKHMAKMAAIAGILVGVMASPQLYEHSEFLQRYTVFSLAYQYGVPAVLKDAAYRWPLIWHVVAMTTIWPLSPMISGLIGVGFKTLKAALETKRGPVTGRIRDFAKTWADMGAWKRIVATGLRAYSFLVVTPIVRVVEGMMQQRALLPAMSLAINPGEVITPESAIGQKVGLEEAMTVGFNKMSIRGLISFLSVGIVGESKPDQVQNQKTQETKMRLLAEVHARKKEKHNYSKILAGLVVAQHYEIPASVIQDAIVKQNFNLSDLRILAEDPEARRMRDLVDAELQKRIAEMPIVLGANGGEAFDPEEYQRHFALAEAAAERIAGLSNGRKYVREMWLKTKIKSFAVWNYVLNQGRTQAETLYNLMPNEEAWRNTQREFILDHLMVVFMPALWGDRANFAKRDQMAADPTAFLNTSGVAAQDVVSNTSAHFFKAGATFVLMHQLVKAVTETLYEPIDKVINRVLYRDDEGQVEEGVPGRNMAKETLYDAYLEPQKLGAGLWQFAKSLRPSQSDIGGQALRGIKNSTDLFFAYMYFGMFFRLALGHQGFQGSFIGLSLQWLLAPTFISTWWWVLQKGNVMYSQFFEDKQDEFLNARTELAQAGRETDPSVRETRQKSAIWDLFLMFDEGKPEAIDSRYHPLTTEASLDEQAVYWTTLASRVSPGAMVKNRWVPWLASGLAAFGSTYTFIPVSVWSTTPELQNWTTLSLAMLEFAVFMPSFIFLLSKKSWTERFPKYAEKVTAGARAVGESVRRGCEGLLGTR